MKFLKSLFLFSLLSLFIFPSCKKDKMLTDANAKLGFSTDSILFDTVFTTVGSTTKNFRIYNTHKQPMTISKVSLGAGSNSQFRINVDGVSGTSITNTEILAGDSLYVFVQVTVNPTSALSPLLIKDSIIFETNGNLQYVNLTAIGRNVYLQKPDHFPTNGLPPYSIIGSSSGPCNTTYWTNDKPHLIFGYAVVDSCCKLIMNPGTQVYLNKYAVLWVYKDGCLQVKGSLGNEVTFQGARLEPEYKEIPGQWGKIWLMKGSINNIIDWAKIKNGAIGVQAEAPDPTGTLPYLQLTNTIITNMEAAALYSINGNIQSNNCVFANCGQYVAALTQGGTYNFEQCTFADYWNSIPTNGTGGSSGGTRSSPLLVLNNFNIDNNNVETFTNVKAYFGNCIIHGELADEISLDSTTDFPGYHMNFVFDYSLLKTATVNTGSPAHFISDYINNDPGFKDPGSNNYNLNATTFCYQKGDPGAIVPYLDLNGVARGTPADLGAYQRNP